MIHILENIETWRCEYKKCGAKCCSEGIHLTLLDIKRIKELGYSTDNFLDFDESNNTFIIKGKNGKCFFLGSELECTIRENEPIECRLLPFKIVEVSYSDEPIMNLKPVLDCPGEGHGKKINKNKIEDDAMSFIRENQKLIRELRIKSKKIIIEDI